MTSHSGTLWVTEHWLEANSTKRDAVVGGLQSLGWKPIPHGAALWGREPASPSIPAGPQGR